VKHLALIGLMGAGKSTVGRAAAARLQRPFVDTDELVEASTGKRVAEIFAEHGEAKFRELERVAVADACASPEPLVIACGGGAAIDADNRNRLRSSACVVWLRASPDVLAARLGTGTSDRPLLRSRDPREELGRLAALRQGAYESTAHATVDTDGRDIDDVVTDVVEELERCGV